MLLGVCVCVLSDVEMVKKAKKKILRTSRANCANGNTEYSDAGDDVAGAGTEQHCVRLYKNIIDV